ncbi:alpha/beta fold hydrolase [Mesobacillus selenatarsenatis]|uniref:Alpha/beta hydrolase n=1 Tax=Mesobacillus selenatarsenatis TaxID=388741 RepID=A0A846TMU2_9BACI|nr:alpha/beta hydrolase [Mesobacillus selenatarsenatis]NKE08260.1 alpha/beta hydrolase [Mesobacillus selenatarsenatis]
MSMLNMKNATLYYTEKGSGTPIVFIHPPVLTSVNFQYQLEELSKKFRIITFDIRGHGKSLYSPEPITYPLIIKDIISLLDHLNIDKAFIGGYSTGGSIVLEFMLRFPERALGGIPIGAMADVHDDYLRKKISLGIKLSSKGAINLLAWSISWSNSNNIKLFKHMFSEAKKGDYRNIEQYYRYSLKYNCVTQLHEINLPIMLVYGKKDKPFLSYARQLHDKLLQNELHFIENVDHRVPTKGAKELNQLITQFINTK